MLKTVRSRILLLAVALAILVLPSWAGVIKVRAFKLATPRDRRILFNVAATPSGDILSFVASNTGVWHLHRVRNWLAGTPTDDVIPLNGYFSKEDAPNLELLNARVFVTADGAYAVCVGSAVWIKRVKGRAAGPGTSNDVITVVDLRTFKVVATAGTSSLGLFWNREVTVDPMGRVLVDSLSDNKTGISAFIQLTLPLLKAGPICKYRWITDSQSRRHPEPTTETECREASGATTLEKYLSKGDFVLPREFTACDNNDSAFCHLPGQNLTVDGKFGIADSEYGHDNIFGSYATTRLSYAIFSVAKRMDIGEIKLPTDHSARMVLAYRDARNFLLTIQDATIFSVYELQE